MACTGNLDQTADPENILAVLDLERPGLEKVRAAYCSNDTDKALADLNRYFRDRDSGWYPAADILGAAPARPEAIGGKVSLWPDTETGHKVMRSRADDILEHKILARGDMPALGYGPYDYGREIDWNLNPYNNLNWPACMHRFTWDEPLAYAFLMTGDEKYAAGWFRLAGDWILKHRPFARHDDAGRPMAERSALAWGALQVGVRSCRMTADFEIYRHSQSFTPRAMARVLTGLHDAARHTATQPELTHHNPTLVEAEGLLTVAVMFPEFEAASHWKQRALDILEETVGIQVTQDGVQGEWGINYHIACTLLLTRIMQFLCENAERCPPDLEGTVHKMYDHVLASLSPDRQYPMFSDARRPTHNITGALRRGTALFGDPKYAAVLDGNCQTAPAFKSAAFPKAGLYFFRSGWREEDIYLAVHCSPPARSNHDQPDNGTFELYAYGKWLMPDSGCYAYGHGTEHQKLRPWFGATRNHQTLTVDERDSVNAARHRLWIDQPGLTVAVFENGSYPDLLHRRSICFIDERFFVLVDDAIGNLPGKVMLHFQLQPGPATFDHQRRRVFSSHPEGANVLVSAAALPLKLEEQEGWTSAQFHERTPRPAFRLVHAEPASCRFVSIVYPFRGVNPPAVTIESVAPTTPDDGAWMLRIREQEQSWIVESDLNAKTVTATKLPGYRGDDRFTGDG